MRENGFEVTGVSSKGKELEEVQKEEGIKTVNLEMTRTISPFQDIKSLWSFYRWCKREKPQIVHSHTPKAGIVGMLGARLAGVPIRLHTVAGLPLMEAAGVKRKILDLVEKLTYRSATRVYPNSKGLYDFILENNFTVPEKLKVIANGSSNGIDTTYFNPALFSEPRKHELKDALGINPGDFVFVFVGRLVGDKGINELVEAFSGMCKDPGLQDALPGCRPRLLLVGPRESELDPLLPETLQQIQAHPDIISVGFQSDVRPYLAISDALVFPSYREGFPNVVMQAGAMGLPAIVSDINGCNEIIEEGKNGVIIPAKDSRALQYAMRRIMGDLEYYTQLKQNARAMITSRYEQRVVWEALLAEYRQLLEQGNISSANS